MVCDEAAIRFLRFGGRSVAYAVSGEGPPLVALAWWVSHLDLDWRDRSFRSFWDAVGEGRSLVRYDGPGVGMSDRDAPPAERGLDSEVALLGAILDELGLERVALLGGSFATVELIAACGLEVEQLREASWRGMPAIVRPLVAGRAQPI